MKKEPISILRLENGKYDGVKAIAVTKDGQLMISRSAKTLRKSLSTKTIHAEKSSSEYLSGPIKVYFDPTLVCPLECSFCLACAPEHRNSTRKIPHLSKDEVLKIAKQIIDSGALQVKIGGGEPFLYEHFFSLVKILSKNSIAVSTSTNGITLSNLSQKEIGVLQKNHVKVSISIDGDEEYHNRIRDPKGKFDSIFKNAINGLEYLLSNNCCTAIRSTIINSPESVKQIKFLNQLSQRYEVETRIRLAKPMYKANSNSYSFTKPNDLYLEAFKELREIRESNPLINIDDIVNYDDSSNFFNCGLDCSAGTRSCFVNASGELSPCGFLDDKFPPISLLDGKTTLKHEWNNGESFKNIRRYFKKENEISPCSKCRFVDMCQGGCPAVRFFTQEEQDLRCPLRFPDV